MVQGTLPAAYKTGFSISNRLKT